MNSSSNRRIYWLCGLVLVCSFSAAAANLPSDWQHEQHFEVPAAGLIKFSLPIDTLDAARSGLEDLRLLDPDGNELPYMIERPVSSGNVTLNARSCQAALDATDFLAGIETAGTALDVSGWTFRKAVKLAQPGAQQLELDRDVLAHAQPDLADLRLPRGGRQLPYVVERTSIIRSVTPEVTAGSDAKDPRLS